MLGSFKESDERKYLSEQENPEEEVNVCVSITLHKNFKVKVSDYRIVDEWVDEDGNYNVEKDFSTCNLYGATYDNIATDAEIFKSAGWSEDDREIILDK